MTDKRLYRSRRSCMLAGVCGGIGEYFGLDPTLVRLAWAASAVVFGTGVFAYILAAVIIPQEPAA